VEDLRSQILSYTGQFAAKKEATKKFTPGVDSVPVSGKVLSPEDYIALVDSCLDGWFTAGRYTSEFQRKLAKYVGARHALFVNSGSSANLCALSGLTSEKLGSKALKEGDEVITVAMGFPTTVNPIIQNRLTPVVVDINPQTLDIDIEMLKEAVSGKTKAIMLAHTLGNPFDIDAVLEICKRNNLWLIEDSCDALGSTYKGQKTGSFGDTATVSFYPAHHITTGEGGAVFIKSPLVKKQVESFRDWGRDCYCETGCDNTCLKRYDWQLGDLPKGYDHKYIYSHIGYNLKATDMQAALGLSQLNRLEEFIESRKNNYQYLLKALSVYPQLSFMEATPGSDPSWFGFPIILNSDSGIDRQHMLKYLDTKKIGTRLVFAGNILKQPAYKNVKFRVIGNMKNTDHIMHNAFWIGVYPGLTKDMLDFVIECIAEYLDGR
jgi:CDP-6-deoxy-D-xylo-4-hexulose-3-dehydrase